MAIDRGHTPRFYCRALWSYRDTPVDGPLFAVRSSSDDHVDTEAWSFLPTKEAVEHRQGVGQASAHSGEVATSERRRIANGVSREANLDAEDYWPRERNFRYHSDRADGGACEKCPCHGGSGHGRRRLGPRI